MILCCGEALIDLIPQADALLLPCPGGAALNTAIGLARLGAKVGLFAGLSTDAMGQTLRDTLLAEGVDLSLAKTCDLPTTLAVVSLRNGQPSYGFYDENSAGRMLAQTDVPRLPDGVSTLLFGGVSLCHAPAGDCFVSLAESARDRVIMLDPNIRPALIDDGPAYRARLDRMLNLADIVKVSDEDLEWLYPDAPDLPARLARLAELAGRNLPLVLLTQGGGDVLVIQGRRQTRLPVVAVAVQDTVGAGDALNAGFLAACGRLEKSAIGGMDVTAAVRFGIEVASVSVTRSGANPPTGKTVKKPLDRVLVADIGGTNTRIGIAVDTKVDDTTIRRFPNAGVADFETHLAQYLQDMPMDISACCVAVAGPVTGGAAQMTNLDWDIAPARIKAVTGAARVTIINDLAALGYALGQLGESDLAPVLQAGRAVCGARMVVGVGTGFNAAIAHAGRGTMPIVFASESGHMALALQDQEMLELSHFAARSSGFCSVEDLLSGRGLETIYSWESRKQGGSHPLDAQSICAAMAEKSDPVAVATVERFITVLGHVIGDLALSHLPFGGIYLAGSVARGVAPFLADCGFERAFTDKGRKAGLMHEFSLSLINEDTAALQGCALCAANSDT